MAAIDHGADAVYIGAERYGARQAAGNSVEDINRVVIYAHTFGAKVYVTLNTILYENELQDTQRLVWALYEAGVDALIVQDMALLSMELPPIALHASTQMDNRTPERVQWLADLGYEQVVLARELSLDQIGEIHRAVPDMPLEAFVHGALCVSYSGQCYASQYCFGRSANRGECAQFCRLPFRLEDRNGAEIPYGNYPLSLRDMNRSEHLEQMMDAGVSSFKIEGRLKDMAYVKNVTAYYRQRIDAILRRRPEYQRASWGRESYTFTPSPERSFSRSFTTYGLMGRSLDIASSHTPKSIGQFVGTVKEVRRDSFTVAGIHGFANGDGLCYHDEQGQLHGFRVNRAENNRLFPTKMPPLRPGLRLYRNGDQEMERLLSRPSATRKMRLDWRLTDTEQGFSLTAMAEGNRVSSIDFECEHQLARADQSESIRSVLSKMGDTPYEVGNVDIALSEAYFVPRSLLADWRRRVVDALPQFQRHDAVRHIRAPKDNVAATILYNGNVANSLARRFYLQHGAARVDDALELQRPESPVTLMFCHHCIRYQLGICNKQSEVHSPWREPFYLVSHDGRRFRLRFDCHNCQMLVVAE